MLLNFVNHALVIDDNPGEVKGLLDVLNNEDIPVTFRTPVEIGDRPFKKNKNLIFLDLSIDDTKDIPVNISVHIRPILQKVIHEDFGCYGIIVWSKHTEDIDRLKEKLQEDRASGRYRAPLFIVGLDKTKYLREGNYGTLLIDITNELKNDPAALFFMEWWNSVQAAQDKTVANIYSLTPDYINQTGDFKCILKKLAQNHTGIPDDQLVDYPLYIDAFKAFDDILHAELINCQKSSHDIFTNPLPPFSKPESLGKIYSHINTAILIDSNNIDSPSVIPGNVYEILNPDSPFKSDKASKEAINIAIEITPPCDFANMKKRAKARLIGGFMVEANRDMTKWKKQIEELKCKGECFYTEAYPIIIPGNTSPHILILDFRYMGAEEDRHLKNVHKYRILFRSKPKLFADILQKFSSHAARLGLSVIHD